MIIKKYDKTSKLKIFFNKQSNLIYSFMFGTVAFSIIFSFKFLLDKTGFFYQADSLFELAAYHAFLNGETLYPIFNTNKIFPQDNFSLIWLSSSQIYFLILKAFKTIFNLYLFNPLPLYYLINFIIFSYIIQKILNELKVNNIFYISFFQLMILLNPVFINRIVYHLNLITQWSVLLVIYYSIKISRKNDTYYSKLAIFSGLSINLHPYLAFINAVVFMFYMVDSLFKRKYRIFVNSVSLYLLTFVTFFVFIIPPNKLIGESDNFRGAWSAEFNSFFCGNIPNEFLNSKLFCYRPYINYDHEGYLYLGFGVIVGVFYTLRYLIHIKTLLLNYYPLIISSILLLIIAFGNKWKLAHKQIFEFEPNIIFKIFLNAFRSNGRFGWLFYYLVFFGVLYSVYNMKASVVRVLSVLLIVVLQFNDLNINYTDYELKQFNNLQAPSEFIDTSRDLLKNNAYLLNIYPDDRCFHYENFYYQNDVYIFAIVHLSNGGSIDTSRLGRYSGIYFDRSFCDEYDILSQINKDNPKQFVILNSYVIDEPKLVNGFDCNNIKAYEKKGGTLLYCKSTNFQPNQ